MKNAEAYRGLPPMHGDHPDMTAQDTLSDLSTHLLEMDDLLKRASFIQDRLAAQISRLYGEGEPPNAIHETRPQQVGLHHEMAIRIATLRSLMVNIEEKTSRLASYA